MPIVEIAPGEFGLVTVADAATVHACDVRTVQRWIAGGLIPALAVGSGNRTAFLLREKDVRAFVPKTAGRPKKAEVPAVRKKPKGKKK